MSSLAQLIQEVARAMAAGVVAFLVAMLPERYKRDGPLAPFADARMHVLSGALESAVGATLFITGMVAFGHRFGDYVYIYAASQPRTRVVELFGLGALAYISYVLTPLAWLYLYLFVEGIVRSLEVAFHGSLPGLGVLHLGMRLVDLGRRRYRYGRQRVLAGPARADEVIVPTVHPQGLLEIRASRPKSWSERQVLQYAGDFYAMVGAGFGRRGGRYAHWYLFRVLEEREVIRGVIASYPESAPGPGAAEPAEGRDSGAAAAFRGPAGGGAAR